jgi:putative SOS response-associated peptidase YedK
MCGRFALAAEEEDFERVLPGLKVDVLPVPRYNIAPTQPVALVLNDGNFALTLARWGLIPSWAKDPSIGSRMINARAETLLEKPSFRLPFLRQRCLIWATGFYEWKKEGTRKQPMFLHLKQRLFAFAGLWSIWHEQPTCSIITTGANSLVAPIHDRMPVILEPKDYLTWLTHGEQKAELLQGCLRPYPAEEMATYPVSRAVNNPAAEGAALMMEEIQSQV